MPMHPRHARTARRPAGRTLGRPGETSRRLTRHQTPHGWGHSRIRRGASSRRMTYAYRTALAWSAVYALDVLRIAFGILFLWLGVLKVLPGVSPAEPLMRQAMPAMLPIDL